MSCDAVSLVECFPDVSKTLLSFETPGNSHRTQRHILRDLNFLPGQKSWGLNSFQSTYKYIDYLLTYSVEQSPS